MSCWQTSKDVTRDLFEYSNLDYPGDAFLPPPPKSIAEYRARTTKVQNPGIFDDDQEEINIFVSGRGKYQKDRIIRPGVPVEVAPEDDLILQRKIREVSGLGYRNEIIEGVFGGNKSDIANDDYHKYQDHQDLDEILPNLKLYSAGVELASSSSSSSTPTNFQHKINQSDLDDTLKEKPAAKKKSSKKKTFKKWSPEAYSSSDTGWRDSLKPGPIGNSRISYFPPLK